MRRILSQSGLSTIEVMVSLGITSIMIAALTSFMSHSQREHHASTERLIRNDLDRQLTSILADPNVCTAFLKTLTLPASSATATSAKPMVVKNINRIPSSVSGSSPNVVDVGTAASPLAANMVVKSIELIINGPSTGIVQLNFDQSKLTRAIHDLSFPITFQTDAAGTKITGCSSLSTQALCTDMGGTYNVSKSPPCTLNNVVCTATQVLTTDTTGKQVCKNISQMIGSLCPVGQMLVSGGSYVNCQPVPTSTAVTTTPPTTVTPPPVVPTPPQPPSYPKVWVNPTMVCSGSNAIANTIIGYYKQYLSRCAESDTAVVFWSNSYLNYVNAGQTSAQAYATIQNQFLTSDEYKGGFSQTKLNSGFCSAPTTMYPGHVYTYQLRTNQCTTP